MTKAVVIGAGLAGMLTAYNLAREGSDVTIIDQAASCGDGASHANGGQLSYMYADPLGSPDVLRQLPHYILGRGDKPVFISLKPDAEAWGWYLRLAIQSLPWPTKRNAEKILRLNLYSQKVFEEFHTQEPLDFDFANHGKMHIYFDKDAFEKAAKAIAKLNAPEHPQQIMSAAECASHEPALAHLYDKLAGGIFSPVDSAGDALKFIKALAARMTEKNMPVKFAYGHKIDGFVTAGSRIISAIASSHIFEADNFIVAAGCHSGHILSNINLGIPIYPVKGYSITAPIIDEARVNRASITDHSRRMVFSRLGDRLRVAGFAEFCGYDTSINESRIKLMKRWTEEVLPGAVDISKAEAWAGLRPCMPDSIPMLGRYGMDNLYLNTGHGMLGWTMAHGSARIVADQILGRNTKPL